MGALRDFEKKQAPFDISIFRYFDIPTIKILKKQ